MQYLFDTDCTAQLRGTDFLDLIGAEPSALTGLEAATLASAQAVLAPTFQSDVLLAPWRVYADADTYVPGERVRTTIGALYTCHTAAPAATPITDAAYFTPGDSRPAQLVQALVAIITYGLHMRLLPATLPTERKHAAEAAQTRLADWASGQQPAPGWPLSLTSELRQPSGNATEKGWWS